MHAPFMSMPESVEMMMRVSDHQPKVHACKEMLKHPAEGLPMVLVLYFWLSFRNAMAFYRRGRGVCAQGSRGACTRVMSPAGVFACARTREEGVADALTWSGEDKLDYWNRRRVMPYRLGGGGGDSEYGHGERGEVAIQVVPREIHTCAILSSSARFAGSLDTVRLIHW
jgi:hypothetical protein